MTVPSRRVWSPPRAMSVQPCQLADAARRHVERPTRRQRVPATQRTVEVAGRGATEHLSLAPTVRPPSSPWSGRSSWSSASARAVRQRLRRVAPTVLHRPCAYHAVTYRVVAYVLLHHEAGPLFSVG